MSTQDERHIEIINAYGLRFERMKCLVEYLNFIELGQPNKRDLGRIDTVAAFLSDEMAALDAEIERINREGAADE